MVCMKIDEGSAMAVSSKNFDDGMILPRATPARSGTRHSISVTPRAPAQARAWARVVIGSRSWGRDFFFLGMMDFAENWEVAGVVERAASSIVRRVTRLTAM